jgi:glycosyltransferase involved in cell wall biosynthesis
MTAAELAAVASWPALRRPIVTTRHFAARRGHNRVGRAAYRAIPHLVRREIAISEFVAARAGSPCVVIPNGVPAPPAPGRERRPVVLVAQRLEPEKDTPTALRAFAASGLATRGWRLHVAGRGRQEAALRALATRTGVSGSVRFLGHLPDLSAELASAGLFLATAPAEPFGLGVVEAMAAATPVVVAAGGAHLETAGAVTDPAVFPPGDAEACGRELRRLADDPDERDALGRRLRARYEAEYTIERHVDRLERLYDEVLSDGDGGRGR